MPEDNGNGRLLATIDERTRNTAADVTEIKTLLQQYETRIRCVEQEQAAQKARNNIYQGLQAAYTTIIAAVLGVNK